MDDLISRQAAIDAFEPEHDTDWYTPQIIEVLEALPPVQPTQTNAHSTQCNTLDCVSRQEAIDALWKALYKYEDETEKQFQTSDELDVADWIVHRIFVQNMSDIDRQVIINLPSAQPEQKKGRWIPFDVPWYQCSECGAVRENKSFMENFCPNCGARMDGEANE